MKIFISYTSADQDWAHWIASKLQQFGHEAFVHKWKVSAGDNGARRVEHRLGQADRLLGVFSDAYCKALYTQTERWMSCWQESSGISGFLIPVEVRKVSKWPIFVQPLKRLSLVGLDEPRALSQLLEFLGAPKPPSPSFPGAPNRAGRKLPSFSEGSDALIGDRAIFTEAASDENSEQSSTSRRGMKNITQKEILFEERVFAILRAAGFHVKREIRLASLNLDAVAEKREYGRIKHYAIECKKYARDLSVSDASRLISEFMPLLDSRRVDEIWIVTKRLSPGARETLDNAEGFRCFTIDELKADLSNLLGNERPPIDNEVRPRVRTKVGKAVIENRTQIVLTANTLALLIEEKLTSLKSQRPNSLDAQLARNEEIQQFEELKQKLSTLHDTVIDLSSGTGKETTVVESAKSFFEGVRAWWNKSHEKICEKTFDMSMFLTAVGICSLAGSGGQTAVVVSAALVGGKPVVDALKSLKKLFVPGN